LPTQPTVCAAGYFLRHSGGCRPGAVVGRVTPCAPLHINTKRRARSDAPYQRHFPGNILVGSLNVTPLDGVAGLTFISAMTVTITAEQEQFIAEQLKDGHYRSASDVIAQSLGMLRAQEEFIRSNVAECGKKSPSGSNK